MSYKDKLEIGMEVWLEPINNQLRYGSKKPVKAVITKIGRKYFEVAKVGWERFPMKFQIEDLKQKTDYSPDWKFYFDEQHILDEQEHVMLTKHMRSLFSRYDDKILTLEKLRKIHAIIVDKSKE